MAAKYIVCRGSTVNLRTASPFDVNLSSPLALPAAAGLLAMAEPTLSTHRLEPSEVAELSRDPSVQLAREMPIKFAPPVAVAAGTAWGISAVKADVSPFNGAGVVVAILDTGIDQAHPAFANKNIVGQDFTGAGTFQDGNGHGTHCAGTVCGDDVSGKRIGVARGVTDLLIGRVLDNAGAGTSTALFDAMQWAASSGAMVISMSIGFDFPGLVVDLIADGYPQDLATSIALEAYRGNLRMFDAVMLGIKRRGVFSSSGGTVVVAAAGNESKRDINPQYEIAVSLPAASEGVIAVGAAQQVAAGLKIADFSNSFPQLVGPGVAVESAKLGGGTVAFSGTSMATPHAAGVAALWWESVSSQPVLKSAQAVEVRLLSSAAKSGFVASVDTADRGEGLVQAPI